MGSYASEIRMRGLLAIVTGVIAVIVLLTAFWWLLETVGVTGEAAGFVLAPVLPFVVFGGICTAMLTYSKLHEHWGRRLD
jgi:hypothetical protein